MVDLDRRHRLGLGLAGGRVVGQHWVADLEGDSGLFTG
jgi:hypothetical protein